METKYRKEQFEGFTHRFIVRFSIDEDYRNDTNMHLYSNSDSEEELEKFIKERKSANVKEFKIMHKSSKEQDEVASKFLDEVLTNDTF